MNLDINFVRSQFPGLRDDYVFFDNAGGSQIAKQVISRINEYLMTSYVQHGASYSISEVATSRVLEAQTSIRTLINAKDVSEVVMGSSTTMLLRQLSQAMLKNLNKDDEIIVTDCDHEANIGCWRLLEAHGVIVKTWQLNQETLTLDLEDLDQLMSEKTVLVALTHTSNILGTINPIKEVATFVHNRGALICVDGVAYTPHRLVDVQELDVDYYLFSFYKTFGPHHAVLYGKQDLLLKLDNINHFFIANDAIPHKLQPGGPNHELSYGVSGIMDYLLAFADQHNCKEDNIRGSLANVYEIIASYEESLNQRLIEYLNQKDNVRIIGSNSYSKEIRVPTISFMVKGRNSREITLKIDKYNIGIRYGDFYARQLIETLDLQKYEGPVRVSMVHYNTIEEVDKLIQIFEELF